MPGRDMAYFWRYGPFYVAGIYLAVQAAASAGWLAAVWALAAAVILAINVHAEIAYRRSDYAALRRQFLALLRERADKADGWLNRDAHMVFTAEAAGAWWLRRWYLSRADEDQARGLEAGADRVALTADMFGAIPVRTEIMHYATGAVAVPDASGGFELLREDRAPGSAWLVRRVWRHQRMERTGMLYAGPSELREVLAQFRDAEPLTLPS